MDFSSIWRRRHACERCRQLKVRCEYATPAAPACVRCTRQGANCVTRGGLNGSQQHPEEMMSFIPSPQAEPQDGVHVKPTSCAAAMNANDRVADENAVMRKSQAKTIMQLLVNGSKLLRDLEPTPLRQAIVADLYSPIEADALYTTYLQYAGNVLPLPLKDSLPELEADFPVLALAIVTVASLTTSTQKMHEREVFMYNIGLLAYGGLYYGPSSLDLLLTSAVLCTFILPFAERGLTRLFTLYAVSLGVVKKLRNPHERTLAQQVTVLSIIPYAFSEVFTPLQPILAAILDVGKAVQGSARHTIEAMLCYQKTISELEVANSILSINLIYDRAMSTFSFLTDQSDFPSSLNCTFLLAQMKLLRVTALKLVATIGTEELVPKSAGLSALTVISEQASVLGGKLVREFENTTKSDNAVIPVYEYFSMGETLVCLQAIRCITFAYEIDVNIRVHCFFSGIYEKWMQLALNSFAARQAMVSIFKARGVLSISLGHWNSTANHVDGSGAVQPFKVYKTVTEKETHTELGVMTSQELRSFLLQTIEHGYIEPIQDGKEVMKDDMSVERVLSIVIAEELPIDMFPAAIPND